jgi:capsular polysaccharide biosynthesis protein
VFVGLGIFVSFTTKSRYVTYEASTRLLISGAAMSQSEASSVSDIVAAIATDRTQLASVLRDVGARRSADVTVSHVSVGAIGSSGIVDLTVTDRDPVIAVAVANALTERVVEVMRETGAAKSPLPIIIDHEGASITPPPRAIPPHWKQFVALGALFGLVLGIVAAALLEALRPTLVGKEAIAAELGAPVLGVLRGWPWNTSRDVSMVRWQLGAQTKRIGVGMVQLATAGPSIDLLPLSTALATPGPPPNDLVHARGWRGWSERDQAATGYQPDQSSRLFVPGGSNVEIGILDQTTRLSFFPPGDTGLVVVSPTNMKRADLEPTKNILMVTGWPAVGVVAYRRRRLARLVRAPATVTKSVRRNGKGRKARLVRAPANLTTSIPPNGQAGRETSATSAASQGKADGGRGGSAKGASSQDK